MTKENKTIKVGGQAVIEGVMMRSPEFVAVAVRKPDDQIVVKKDPFVSLTKKVRILGLPLIRGGVVLIESLVLGIRALNFSSEVAMAEVEDEKKKDKPKSDSQNKLLLAGTLIMSMGLGFVLFFYVPLLLTEWTGVKDGVLFNLIDGGIRMTIFLLYLILISLWKEIQRIFAYHGAEHKSIFAFEAGQPLTVGDVKPFTTHHPRCGTSFLLVVMMVSILVFITLGRPDQITDRLIRFLFIPVIGGISYEVIQFSTKKWGRWIASTLTAPGLWLQRITTKEPDDKQLEVALVALKASLGMKLDPSVELWTKTV
ncbi:DUF1385 domain-containing protein [candidate division KSB1 bacterium]|nr:DUF1385 domain-containing protein [candidate division KSB1 bacterium]